MKKKAQVQQVFIYIVSLIVVALVLLYGYESVIYLKDWSDRVTLMNFERRLKTSIEKMSPEYGSYSKLELEAPSGFTYICFIDLSDTTPSDLDTLFAAIPNPNKELIKNSVEEHISDPDNGPQYNVFLTGQQLKSYEINGVLTSECFEFQNSKLLLRLKGTGNGVEIGAYSST